MALELTGDDVLLELLLDGVVLADAVTPLMYRLMSLSNICWIFISNPFLDQVERAVVVTVF